MKTMILLSALPGAGKSTWAEQYRRTHKNTYIISSDEIRKELTGIYQNFDKEPEVWKTYLERINNYAQTYDEVTVICDATNLTNHFRKFYYEATPAFNVHILLVISKPWETLLKNNTIRSESKIVPLDVMEKMQFEWEEPSLEIMNMYEEYHRINRWFESNKVPEKFYYQD